MKNNSAQALLDLTTSFVNCHPFQLHKYTTKDFKDTRDSGSQGTKLSTHGHICSYIKEVLTLRAAKTPATATLAVPWMSSLKVQYLLRYFSRNLKAL